MLLVTILVMGFSFYIEFANQLQPCPLCFMQRATAFLFGFFCLFGLLAATLKRAKVISTIQCILTLLGVYFSARQLWLQAQPVDLNTQCVPGLEAMLHLFSWDAIAKSFLWGTTDCARIDWRWFGMSIPLWSGMYFTGMVVFSTYVYTKVARGLRDLDKF